MKLFVQKVRNLFFFFCFFFLGGGGWGVGRGIEREKGGGVLRPIKIFSLILSRTNERFPPPPKKKHLTTRKQNLACPTCDPSKDRTNSGEVIERLRALYTSSEYYGSLPLSH